MIVVDASAVVDVLTRPVENAGLQELLLAGDDLHAPALLDYEVLDSLRGMTLGSLVSVVRAQDALIDLEDLPVERWTMGHGLRRRVYALRHNFTAYDAAYVALAEALDCPLVTRDQRLARAARELVQVEVG